MDVEKITYDDDSTAVRIYDASFGVTIGKTGAKVTKVEKLGEMDVDELEKINDKLISHARIKREAKEKDEADKKAKGKKE